MPEGLAATAGARVSREPLSVGIVTPAFEMAHFLRETIESVLAQDHPWIDYVVMDGGSRDGTVDLLRGYGDRVRWVSQHDGGQADAVNRGLKAVRGDIVTFLNADDTYRPGAVARAVAGLERHPDAGAVYGEADYVDADGAVVVPYPVADFSRERLMHECFVCQPAAFVRRTVWDELGGLDTQLDCAFDYDFWARLSAHWQMVRIEGNLATSRMHLDNKSLGRRGELYRESLKVCKRHFGYVPMSWLGQYARHRVDHVDQFYEGSNTSARSRAVAFALGVRHNPLALRRFWWDWQTDGDPHRFHDGWMGKADRSRHRVPAAAARLVVRGRHLAEVRRPLLLRISAGERKLGRAIVRRRGVFERAFAVPDELRGRDCEVEVASAWTWRPGKGLDERRLSCYLDEVVFE